MEGPCTATLLIGITNGHELIILCQIRCGVIGGSGRLMRARPVLWDHSRQKRDLAISFPSQCKLKVLSARLRGKSVKYRDARWFLRRDSIITDRITNSNSDATNDKYGSRFDSWKSTTKSAIHHPGAQQYSSGHLTLFLPTSQDQRQWRHATINVPSPRQLKVDHPICGLYLS